MAYIIENAHVLKNGEIKDLCLLVENNRILSATAAPAVYKHIRMDADRFIMTPTHVLADFHLPFNLSFAEKKAYYLDKFIAKGCTTILTAVHFQREKEMEPKFKKIRSELTDCPVDYCIGARFPAHKLTPALVRRCKKEKVPVLFLEVENGEELVKIPWGWIKEAMFPYNSLLVPVFKNPSDTKLVRVWREIMKSHGIPSLESQMEEHLPLGRGVLEKTGIIPKKSYLHQGSEVSYNFYLKDRESKPMAESELYLKHDTHLAVTVHNGTVIRAGKHVSYRPGAGEYVEIRMPSFYATPS
ncbi:hypothetical protein [Bacillus sp. FJAT-27251]|uniref:hypothetical protein n=1 Tax=Bacillus sp. FJAT-27251 TaxID=1684142 RepID=UPI0006A76299|nr:hypothetical protein [Bacillus sp. FJAT-27251]